MLHFVLLFLLAINGVSQILARSVGFVQTDEINRTAGIMHGLDNMVLMSNTVAEQVRK